MAKHVTYIPDCPDCGTELKPRMKHVPGTETSGSMFGTMQRWWHCDGCGWESRHVGSMAFAELTDSLTEPLRSR